MDRVDSLLTVLHCIGSRSDLTALAFKSEGELVVLGNGPSLKTTLAAHLDFLKGKSKLCVNEFAHSEYYERLKPEYYVLYDPAYYRQAPAKHVAEQIARDFETIRDKTTWPLKILMPVQAKQWNHFMGLPELNENIEIYYFNCNTVSGEPAIRNYLYDTNKAMPFSYNTLCASIYLGVLLGHKKIYVDGADHSWHEDITVGDDNKLYWRNPHFFDGREPELRPIYVDSYEKVTFKMHEILHSLSLMFQGYQGVEEYAKYRKAKVYNISSKSYIDAFERQRLGQK